MIQTSTSSDMGTPHRVPVRLTVLRCSNLCGVQNSYTTASGQSVGYDTNGNLTSTLAWGTGVSPVSMSDDSQNRLLSAADGTDTVTCTYDTRNRVTSRTINSVTTLFLWDGWNLIEERDMSGNQIRRYVHGAGVDEILMMVDATGAKYHLHDALGSVTALTDDTGAILESYLYDVFGKPSFFDAIGSAQSASSADNRFLFTGREWIAEAGLYDYRNRVYSPVIGRFMQIDPIRFDAGDVNLYRYVGNSALLFIDPFGLDLILAGGGPQNSGGTTWVGVVGTKGTLITGIRAGGDPSRGETKLPVYDTSKGKGGDAQKTTDNGAQITTPENITQIDIDYTNPDGTKGTLSIQIDTLDPNHASY